VLVAPVDMSEESIETILNNEDKYSEKLIVVETKSQD
jgi:hypothetical protein